ncbi:MAG: N-formylglutamate amidohydrolase [Mesorhizobium sp.]
MIKQPSSIDDAVRDPVQVSNWSARGDFVIVCEHASNWLPSALGTLGLARGELHRHIAWDPGALPVSRKLAALLDAPLVVSQVSRLAIDCNRPLDAPDLVPAVSETTVIPGNEGLSEKARDERIALSHRPFHDVLSALIDERLENGRRTAIVTIHSFTPVYKGVARPWHVGVIHDEDMRLAAPMLAGLRRLDGVVVGDNEPYSPDDRVYYTLERHARSRGLPCAMVEIRNDDIADEAAHSRWASRLAAILAEAAESLDWPLAPGVAGENS